jgi:hypothetical protein
LAQHNGTHEKLAKSTGLLALWIGLVYPFLQAERGFSQINIKYCKIHGNRSSGGCNGTDNLPWHRVAC